MVYLRLRGLTLRIDDPGHAPVARRLALASVVAAGSLALSLAGEAGAWTGVMVVVALIAIALAIRPLLPPGTLRARRGLPSVVLMRALIAGALFGAEIYVPYLLIDEYGFSATAAGFGLTAAALLTLAYATPQNQGFNSSALSISDSIGAAASIAVMGLTFVALKATDASFPAVFLIAAALAVLAVVPGLRMGRVAEAGPADGAVTGPATVAD